MLLPTTTVPVGMSSWFGFLGQLVRTERPIRVPLSSEPRSRDEQSSMGLLFGTLLVLSQCDQDVEGAYTSARKTLPGIGIYEELCLKNLYTDSYPGGGCDSSPAL